MRKEEHQGRKGLGELEILQGAQQTQVWKCAGAPRTWVRSSVLKQNGSYRYQGHEDPQEGRRRGEKGHY